MKTMKYKYRLSPTAEQESLLIQFCGAQRYVWNHFLAKEMERYADDGKFNFYYSNAKALTELKKKPETEWMNGIPSTSLQQTIRNLDRALKQSFRGKNARKGFPKFKSRRNFAGSFSLAMIDQKRIKNGTFNMPKLGCIKVNLHRPLPSDFKSAQVKWEHGNWFLVLTVKIMRQPPVSIIYKFIGLDFNSQQIVVDSEGKTIQNPKFLTKAKQKLIWEQRRLSKKVKGSANRKKQQLRVLRAHGKIARTRKDFLDKLSRHYVDSYDLICLEDLNVAGMSKFNGHMVGDAGWSALRAMITYKADLYGKHVSVIDRYFPSSKMCFGCGQLVNKSLAEREHVCDCGFKTSRDHNAALNIAREGLDILNRAGTVPIHACGDLRKTQRDGFAKTMRSDQRSRKSRKRQLRGSSLSRNPNLLKTKDS